jgi:hypothetical protein
MLRTSMMSMLPPQPYNPFSCLLTPICRGMNMLEAKKDKHVVAPGINWLIATRKSQKLIL